MVAEHTLRSIRSAVGLFLRGVPPMLWALDWQPWLSNECLLEQGLSNSHFFHVFKIPYMVKLQQTHFFVRRRKINALVLRMM